MFHSVKEITKRIYSDKGSYLLSRIILQLKKLSNDLQEEKMLHTV